jgi:hypothetical protein
MGIMQQAAVREVRGRWGVRVVEGHLQLLWREVALCEVQGRLSPDRASPAPSMRLPRASLPAPHLSRTLL